MSLPTKSILTISRDPTLQHTRTLVLERAGYRVVAVVNDNDALASIKTDPCFDLVLFCHSVPEESRVLLADEIKGLHPDWPIMMLYNGFDPTQARVDGSLHNLESPEKVLGMVDFLTTKIERRA
jgi:CheY-like chemotaxis protein